MPNDASGSKIKAVIQRFFQSLVEGDHSGMRACLNADGESARIYEVYGFRLLRLLFDSIAGQPWHIRHLEQQGRLASAVLGIPNQGSGTALWLQRDGGRWRILNAYPVRVDVSGAVEGLSEEALKLLGAKPDLPISCQDEAAAHFLRPLDRQIRERSAEQDPDFQGKVTSVVELASYLWTRKMLWKKMQRQGFEIRSLLLTLNNDLFFAERSGGSERVAIKALRNPDPSMREAFLYEIELLRALAGHPQVPALIESSAIDGWPYFISLRAPGKPLDKVLEGSPPWSFGERLSVANEVIQGANGLRRRNVIHRDIAPDNIVVGKDLQITFIDFGMGRFAGDLKPSKLRRANAKEIRNLGLTVCHLLTEKPAPQFGSAGDCLESWRRAVDKLYRLDLPEACAAIVKRSLAADPECRSLTGSARPYNTINQMITDLERLLKRL